MSKQCPESCVALLRCEKELGHEGVHAMTRPYVMEWDMKKAVRGLIPSAWPDHVNVILEFLDGLDKDSD